MIGDLAIDYGHRRVTVGGNAVDLTATEYELRHLLSLDTGRVVTFETLLRRVWPSAGTPTRTSCGSSSGNLRRTLGDRAASPVYLFNERGVAYRMAKPPDR